MIRKTAFILICFCLISVGIVSYQQPSNSQPLNESTAYYNYIQPSFEQYIESTRTWLQENRTFISSDHQKELDMNAPFQIQPENANKAILLIHGLSDAPYSFVDLSNTLSEQGFHVQALLLPGHGSSTEHLNLVRYEDWQQIIEHYTHLLKQKYDEVWLGGYSLGGNLASVQALEDPDVKGLLLFAPAFQSQNALLEKFIPLISLFLDGENKPENNLVKYNYMKMNGYRQYSRSATIFRNKVASKLINIPTLLVISEADNTVDAYQVKTFFENKFTHTSNQLIWYGDDESVTNLERANTYSMARDDLNIRTGSHVNVIYSPSNPYYGQQGEKVICLEEQEHCKQRQSVWFAANGYSEKGKVFARLTWNPYFEQLKEAIIDIVP